jgi:hypothetical protein
MGKELMYPTRPALEGVSQRLCCRRSPSVSLSARRDRAKATHRRTRLLIVLNDLLLKETLELQLTLPRLIKPLHRRILVVIDPGCDGRVEERFATFVFCGVLGFEGGEDCVVLVFPA